MAYNEETNIAPLLEALSQQRLKSVDIAEIIVVASGCTDRTEAIVRDYSRKDARVKLLVQGNREGKSSAINLLLWNTSQEVVVLESADTLPRLDTIEALVSPFADPSVGMTGGRPVPTNDPTSFMGFAAHLLWQLHHRVSLHKPKMGELVAFRRYFRQIPHESAVDEASIEPLIKGQGLQLLYVPEAVVLNRGPETVGDFFKQRRRIFAGHLYVKDTLGYKVSTMNSLRILPLFLQEMKPNRRYLLWGSAVMLLECLARLIGAYDYIVRKKNPFVWPVAKSTKDVVEVVGRASAQL
jgi:cellulose synthase/poly-beta-1,6-N-acetylglucosamine synthase-like glycosyltransferase